MSVGDGSIPGVDWLLFKEQGVGASNFQGKKLEMGVESSWDPDYSNRHCWIKEGHLPVSKIWLYCGSAKNKICSPFAAGTTLTG